MNRNKVLLAVIGLLASSFTACGGGGSAPTQPPKVTPPTPPPTSFQETFVDPSGTVETFSHQEIDRTNPFFAKLGTNQRSCASCHDSTDGWSVTPAHLQQTFQSSQGADSIFDPIDAANCPSADVSTFQAKTSAYSLLLNSGLIRMSIPLPANADFGIVSVSDPYQCAETSAAHPAFYRRPLPATNLKFATAIMWDGREPDLQSQARDATMTHARPTTPPTDAQLQQIVSLESSLFTAQSQDSLAGDLTAQGANGGPQFLSTQTFSAGMNSGAGFDPDVFNLYSNWTAAAGNEAEAQQAVARGEVLFNTFPITISTVPGFNDVQGQSQIVGTCSTCHNTPNVGGNSSSLMMNIGAGAALGNLPLYGVQCNDGTQVLVADLGRAMVTGKCADIGKFKIPSLRGLAARAPYFHNGAANSLLDVLNFYQQRFNMLLSADQKNDLIAFMNTL
jgi:cytochrome c peroxidase